MSAATVHRRRSSPLTKIQDPAREIPAGEMDIRVEDYLSDKIQTAADLKDLDSLISKVEEQKKLLQLQVSFMYSSQMAKANLTQ